MKDQYDHLKNRLFKEAIHHMQENDLRMLKRHAESRIEVYKERLDAIDGRLKEIINNEINEKGG
jgi:hypothetical protein